MSSTESRSVEDLDIDSSDCDSLSSDEADTETDSDLQDLYESFDFEDEASRSQSSAQAQTRGDTTESETCLPLETARRSFSLGETALYDGSPISTLQSHLLIFQYAIRHGLTTKSFTELLQLLSVHLPQKASIPKSVHSLKRFFVDAFPEAQAVQHFYCSCCQRPLPSPTASCIGSGCSGGSCSIYITIPLAPQLKRMMEDTETWLALQHRFEQLPSGDMISDIYDGDGYKRHSQFLSHPAHISLLLNTDGVALYRSSSVSIWPVWAVINELPATLRFLRQHMLLLGVFYSVDKPTMNMYLRPIVDDLLHLLKEGTTVQTPAGVMNASAIVLNCSLDLPARAVVTNMKQYNGRYGCLYCEEEGTTIGGDHLHRYWPCQTATVPRTHASLLQNAHMATTTGTCVLGVKGPTVLALLPSFDLVWGVVIDDLHGIFLGVTLTLLHLWFDKANKTKLFFIGNKVKQCDERLLTIQVTDSMSRVPRSLEDFKHWKGAELRNWLLFFSVPVLHGILPNQFLSHLALLVGAIYLYSSQCISYQEHQLGQRLLEQFYEQFSALYGVKSCSMNVHLLYHLPRCIKMWGPLWSYSCFHFENQNGYLKTMFHGTRDMTRQMAFSYIIMQALPPTFAIFSNSPLSVSTFASIVYGKKKVIKQAIAAEVGVLGGISLQTPMPCDAVALTNFLHKHELELPSGQLTRIYRIEFQGVIYYSRTYQRVKKRNSYTVLYQSDAQERFGIIEYFVFLHQKIIAVLKLLSPISVTCKDHFNLSTTVLDTVSFLTPVVKSNTVECCFVEDFVNKCLFIDLNSIQYVCQFPSTLNFD